MFIHPVNCSSSILFFTKYSYFLLNCSYPALWLTACILSIEKKKRRTFRNYLNQGSASYSMKPNPACCLFFCMACEPGMLFTFLVGKNQKENSTSWCLNIIWNSYFSVRKRSVIGAQLCYSFVCCVWLLSRCSRGGEQLWRILSAGSVWLLTGNLCCPGSNNCWSLFMFSVCLLCTLLDWCGRSSCRMAHHSTTPSFNLNRISSIASSKAGQWTYWSQEI